ncbi:site-specific DNA-methyltransferase [Brucella intermedia]|uniref:site-specific DNA-methyltransferase n=1 Tax=Brucella intermedia TaxID=94625 RepID=UPI00178C3483|nr:site-specific DNA-methyltransferase [Brucella intermedia]
MAKKPIEVEALKHDAATRKNIPTAEFESVMREADKTPIQLAYERRNRDLDPQLVWRGKDEQDWSDLIVSAPPLYIQEKVHPKVIIDDLKRESKARADEAAPPMADLFADFNGLRDAEAATEFYQHNQHWSNRMISGDSLSVMASLAEREGLRGQVQCIYFDPPYGIKFNSNFQWSTTSRDVKDGAKDHITREPEQVRAFRDTWRDGIHSYLTYLRDRLTVARDLLHESGSIFVQIGDENVHRVRALMDEVFGEDNFVSQISFKKTSGTGGAYLDNIYDIILWFARKKDRLKFRRPLQVKSDELLASQYTGVDELRKIDSLGDPSFLPGDMSSQGASEAGTYPFGLDGRFYELPPNTHWKASRAGMPRLARANRLVGIGKRARYKRFADDYPIVVFTNTWDDTIISGYSDPKMYVVQTSPKVVQRCILMTTDPGDLVLDPTCGSGTTAYVAEQWGRRWITIDTSRVAIALARSRLMGARYPYYLLADSPEGQAKEGEVTRTVPKTTPTRGDIRLGFVYERVPHITLKSIANNAEIDVIWERMQPAVEEARAALNAALKGHTEPFKVETGGRAGTKIDFKATGEVKLPSGEAAPANGFMEWEIPRETPKGWPDAAKAALARFWEARIARQKEVDASIAAKAEFEYLYDKPYPDNSKVRVAGPFTVESLSPHRTLAVDWNDELIDVLEAGEGKRKAADRDESVTDFAHMILENLKAAGVQQAHKEDRITFTSLTGWPGRFICAEGTFMEGEVQRRAGIFIGPEFGTVSRPDLVAAAREAGDAGFDVLIACAFNYDAHSAEFDKLGRVPVLKARMNPDLHMGGDLKSTGAGNLFVIFGEPDIKIEDAGEGMIRVKVFGVDVFKPQSGEVVSEGTDGIALWMLDTDYNEESFFVRHAYFLGANDPYKALKTTLKAEIDEEAWESLHSDTSRPFPKPASGRIAVKVINHLGDEVMKVFAVG